ncbi:MAG: CotH kinase family protein [Anaerolineales bacterium]|nr:CotH kinase family protein [Anaerolineales bacterium]
MKKLITNLTLIFLIAVMTGCAGTTAAAETDALSTIAQDQEYTTTAADEESPAALISETSTADTSDEEVFRPANWSEETHSNDVDSNYDVVFPENKVNQITITIDPADWEAMQANMVALFGEQGSSVEQRGGALADEQSQLGDRPLPGERGNNQPPGGFNPPVDGERPEMAEGGIGGDDVTSQDPMWVEATVEFDGNIWTNVGVRYKGNSSLNGGWRSGTTKLPLKLDFDEFEDEYPEIDNQRFYGFKQLSLANGYNDTSFLRDAASSQILEEASLPVAKTAFYEVFLDYGEGPVSLGLYTMIEVIDDTAVERYFGEDEGNIYEAEGSAASFAANTYDRIEASFQKENNSDSDWSDIEALFAVLHSNLRNEDPAAWRAELESIFDVDDFIEWLAIAAVIEHWDSYGNMDHNYYLYNDFDTGKLTWISWDHNETMSTTGMGSGARDNIRTVDGIEGNAPNNRGGTNRTVSLDKSEIGDNWPLIRFLLDDPIYYELYINDLAEIVAGPFNPDHMVETYQSMADLIAPYAAADVGEEAFNNAVQQLIAYAYQRAEAVDEFLSGLEK